MNHYLAPGMGEGARASMSTPGAPHSKNLCVFNYLEGLQTRLFFLFCFLDWDFIAYLTQIDRRGNPVSPVCAAF
jgi:hypothetical protein